ncbi:MAG: hypothetical protein MJ141_00730 [Clostridia bacterium]|nr:hypothetical protein [Clostridia bacterium]
MCNICGYSGSRRAAPILIDMMKKQEGFWGGYYIGLSTMDENGTIYTRKVLGNLKDLLRDTDAADLPGTIGIMHTRTPSGGGREWSYPFVSTDGKLSFVENGSLGRFEGKTDFVPAAVSLLEKGHVLTSQTKGETKGYPLLPDGSSMHYSDIQCHLVEENMRSGLDPLAALMKTLADYPCEDVMVMIASGHPDTLFATRACEPMFIARAEGEVFLATSPEAFPETEYSGVDQLPANSGSAITPAGLEMRFLVSDKIKVALLTEDIASKGLSLVEKALDEGKALTVADIFTMVGPLFPGDGIPQASVLSYQIIHALLLEKKARVEVSSVPGMVEGLTAPVYKLVKA